MTKLAFDMSSYIKTSMNAGTDSKDGIAVLFNDEVVTVPSAEYGYENVTNMMLHTLREVGLKPKDCILVFEGLSSKSKRLLMDPNYKGKRDKKPPEFYEQFARLREFVEQQWLGMGAISMCQDYAEADDTLAWLAQNTEEHLIIASRDSDLGVLNGTNQYQALVETWNDGLQGIAKIDGQPWVHPNKYITLYKALVGDSSDSVPGVKGFGPAKFQALAEKYGYDDLDELEGLLEAGNLGPLHELAEEMDAKGKKHTHPLIKMIIDFEADAKRCWKVVKMYPEWVNTMKHPLAVVAGKNSNAPADCDERLKDFYSQEWLVTADNYDDTLAFFQEWVEKTDEVTFDIESSTPDESDEWLKAGGRENAVDQIGSILSGFSFTFGPNNEFTFYVSVDHAQTNNVAMSKARELIEVAIASGKKIIIHNTFFELVVLALQHDEDGTPWVKTWENLGARGFLPNALDTKMEASYVDENKKLGLKLRSKLHLGYEQTSYDETTLLTGKPEELPAGGRLIEVLERRPAAIEERVIDGVVYESPSAEDVPTLVTRRYKMRELTGEHVTAYGCDDTICTAALHNYFKLMMQLEHTWQVYLDTEIDAAYQHAKNYVDGAPFSLEKMRELEKIDNETFDRAWGTVRGYLMNHGWEGTVPPTYTAELTPKQIKEAYQIVVLGTSTDGPEIEMDLSGEAGDDDEEDMSGRKADTVGEDESEETKDLFLATKVRTPAKLVALLRELGHETFAGMVEQCLAGEHEKFTAWVREHFSGEPIFKISNKQITHLLYEVMALPVRVRNKPTDIMRKEGKPGNPKGDALAIEYALREATDEQKEVLQGLKLMTMIKTRRSLYYSKYPYLIHWKTGRIHSSHNQCATNTRRASSSDPNSQQLPKHPKIAGEPARFRETIVPHKPGAVIVSMDFVAQELRVIADYSRDPNMVACYIGDNLKDMHALTGASVLQWREKSQDWSYPTFVAVLDNSNHPMYKKVKEHRNLGKKINFTTEFGAMAPKLAMTMLVTEAEAQVFIDAKEKNFPGVRKWKDATIAEAKKYGIVRTKGGAVRHLRDAFNSDQFWIKSKAERQSVNFKVQSSSAEMTKKAEGRMWQQGLFFDYDAICVGPVHDEIVASVMVDDRFQEFLEKMHWCMVQPYGGMFIPIESSISFGKSFGEQVELGSSPAPDVIAKGLKEVYGEAVETS